MITGARVKIHCATSRREGDPRDELRHGLPRGTLHGFIAPEIIKKKVPLVVITDEKDAEYILTGASIKGDDKWYHSVFGGKDKSEGNVQLVSVKDKQMVWAGEAGDRSMWWGGLRRGGQRKVADRIVKQMKKDLFEK